MKAHNLILASKLYATGRPNPLTNGMRHEEWTIERRQVDCHIILDAEIVNDQPGMTCIFH